MPTFTEPFIFKGPVTHQGGVNLPVNCVGDDQVQTPTAPGGGIDPTKVRQKVMKTWSQVHGTAATAERRVIHIADGQTGELQSFTVGVVAAAVGDSTITIDLLKNGVSILDAAVTIDSGDAAFAKVAATIDTAAYAEGDVFEVSQTVSAGTGTLPQGAFARLAAHEDPSGA